MKEETQGNPADPASLTANQPADPLPAADPSPAPDPAVPSANSETITTADPINDWASAERARREGRFEAALTFFSRPFRPEMKAASGWRVLFCLRRLGRLAEARERGEKLAVECPEVPMIKSELAWLEYVQEIKPARAAKDWARMQAAAWRMGSRGAGPEATRAALFAGLEAAKAQKDWEGVIRFCQLVRPADLDGNPRLINGRKIPSERESWYYALLKALLAAHRFAECRTWAAQAAQEFPRRLDFARWRALAAIEAGDPATGRAELEALTTQPRCPWYVEADLARLLHEENETDAAWDRAIRAMRSQGETKAKVNLIGLLAVLAEQRQNAEAARDHLVLAVVIRQREDWGLPAALTALIHRYPLPDPLPAFPAALQACRRWWGEAPGAAAPAAATNPAGPETVLAQDCQGTLILRDPTAPFGFIRSPSFEGNVFVLTRDLPADCRQHGAILIFTAVRSFDRKKNREGVRATRIRPVGAAPATQIG
ncbi:MAG: hypothetical protein GX442_05830 [Candidatus Riflebacteria bacterium]|nr:hypothetical protein [Candidatus Riflebacteria bacterium]